MRPEYLEQGEQARLFPVLSNTSKEGRTTSIFLACLAKLDEFGHQLISTAGLKPGKRALIEAYTEPVLKGQKGEKILRPDGLLVVKSGSKIWRALIEAKVANNELVTEQIENYRVLAKQHGIDCVITISNQFATAPDLHPISDVRKSRSKVPVYHWSWMYILTTADLMIANDNFGDADHKMIVNELRRFLSHESAGVRGFDRMPPEWKGLNTLVSAGGKIPAKSPEADAVIAAWHQETRDLSLILSRLTGSNVLEKLPKAHRQDAGTRQKDELSALRDEHVLRVSYDINSAASPVEVVADLPRRTVEVGMTLRAPLDRVSSKARLNWLLRQLKTTELDDIYIRLFWPGRSEDTLFAVKDLLADPGICEESKGNLQVHSFHVFLARRLGGRFVQQANFVSELELAVPEFYREIGQNLVGWQKPAAKIKPDKASADEVSLDAIANQAEDSVG